jgi:thiamine-monophosphate kinase
LESPEVQPDLENRKYLVGRLIRPDARKDVIAFFKSASVVPTAMMDISDGLSSEVLHICKQSELGAVIYEEKIPVHDDTREFAYKLEIDPTACALSGGEDYELLFTIGQTDYEKIKDMEGISVIGYMTEGEKGASIITKGGNQYPITAQGWNAFK